MRSKLIQFYKKLVIDLPTVSLLLCFLLIGFFSLFIGNFKLDASSDSLVLEDDADDHDEIVAEKPQKAPAVAEPPPQEESALLDEELDVAPSDDDFDEPIIDLSEDDEPDLNASLAELEEAHEAAPGSVLDLPDEAIDLDDDGDTEDEAESEKSQMGDIADLDSMAIDLDIDDFDDDKTKDS